MLEKLKKYFWEFEEIYFKNESEKQIVVIKNKILCIWLIIFIY